MTTFQKEIAKGIVSVRCNLCRVDDATPRYQIPAREDQRGVYGLDIWNVVECNQCGLHYVNPQPDLDALNYYYQFDNEADSAYVQDWFIANADLQKPTWQRYLRAMTRVRKNSGELLDVGCGAGSFLVEAREVGYRVTGQEVAPYFIQYGRETHGLNILEGELDELGLNGETFDVVTSFDVVEHHPDPHRLVKAMNHVLKTGGLLVAGTHDIGNFYAKRYGNRWRYLQPIGHLTYFSRDTLCQMLTRNGFRVVHVGGIHTVDGSDSAENKRKITQFVRVIFLRSLILGVYKPIATRWPRLQRWRLTLGKAELTHAKLLMRAGKQVIMDDNMLVLAVKEGPCPA